MIFLRVALWRRFLPADPEGLFTFSAPKESLSCLQEGSFVQVLIGKSEAIGVVVALSSSPPLFATRSLQKVLDRELFPASFFFLAQQLSDVSRIPLARAISLFFSSLDTPSFSPKNELWIHAKDSLIFPPKLGKKAQAALFFVQSYGPLPRKDIPFSRGVLDQLFRYALLEYRDAPKKKHSPDSPFLLSVEQERIATEVLSPDFRGKKGLLFGDSGSGKMSLIQHLAKEMTDSGGVVVVLFPEVALLESTSLLFQKSLSSENMSVFHSQKTKRNKAETWFQAKQKSGHLFLITRAGLFLPFHRIDLVVILEEHETHYEQERFPTYDSRFLAEKWAEYRGASLIFSSSTPRAETFFLAKKGKIRFWTLPRKKPLPTVTIVDLKQEEQGKNMTLFSAPLIRALQRQQQRGGKSFLLLNKRGLYRVIVCKDCGEVVRNPENGSVLVAHQKEGQMYLLCHQSGKIFRMPSLCSHCGGHRLSPKGQGTAGGENLLMNFFPREKVIRIDRDSTRKKNAFQDLMNQVSKTPGAILIGTQMVTKAIDSFQISLVGILDADQGIHFPDFRAEERVFQDILQAAHRAGTEEERAEVILQTRIPQHPLFSFLEKGDTVGFLEAELQQREQFFFPPFSVMSVLSFRGKEKKKVFAMAREAEESWRIFLQDTLPHERWEIVLVPLPRSFSTDLFRIEVKIFRPSPFWKSSDTTTEKE